MNRKSRLTDALVTVSFGVDSTNSMADSLITPVCPKTLNPTWNFTGRFEFTNDDLVVKKPLLFSVYDKDTSSDEQLIGTVFIDLSRLFLPDSPKELSGLFPIRDPELGYRGLLRLSIVAEVFGSLSTTKLTPANVLFLHSSIPHQQYPFPALPLAQQLSLSITPLPSASASSSPASPSSLSVVRAPSSVDAATAGTSTSTSTSSSSSHSYLVVT